MSKATSRLENHKAPEAYCILNEFIKQAPAKVICLLIDWFNLTLDSSIVQSDWCLGIIKPIFKKKGSRKDPYNYRGITLLSCLGKLFTSVLTRRLNEFFYTVGVICYEQDGFCKGFLTMDHVFSLQCILNSYLQKKKRVYCALLDYKKAFDMLDRSSLWVKMSVGIRAKIF